MIEPRAPALAIHFHDGSTLLVRQTRLGLALALEPVATGARSGSRPTARQREYPQFISRYISKYGGSPAESDIGQHFLLSASSANRMVQTLERRGFIARQKGVPRSIEVLYRD